MRRIRVFGHPLHPPLTHFPLGLLCTVPVWDALALFGVAPFGGAGSAWWMVGFWTLALGLLAAVPAALTGLLDYAVLPRESPAGTTAVRHLVAAGTAVTLSGGSLLARTGGGGPEPESVFWAVGLGVAGALVLGLAGWLGAELTFGHGVGVEEPGREGDRP